MSRLEESQLIFQALIQQLKEKQSIESVRSLRQLIVVFKDLNEEVKRSSFAITNELYQKMLSSLADVAKEVSNEAFDYAVAYCEKVFHYDLKLLEKLLAGENPYLDEHCIGFYQPDWNPKQSSNPERINALEQAARNQRFDTFYFSGQDINSDNQSVEGTSFSTNERVHKSFKELHVLSTQNPKIARHQRKEERELRQAVPVLQHSITDKLYLAIELHGESELSGLFVPSVLVHSATEVLEFLETHNMGVLKDVKVERGEGIYFIRKLANTFEVKKQREISYLNQDDLEQLLKEIIIPQRFIIQRYIDSKLDGKRAADVRLYTVKDRVGSWQLGKDYMRLSAENNILTHTYYGGERVDTLSYLINIYGEEHGNEAYQALREVAVQISKDVDRLYGYACDEFGIDLVIDNQDQIWMYEVNTGPWTGFFEKERASYLMAYAKYIAASGVHPHNRFQNRIGFCSENTELTYYPLDENKKIVGYLTNAFSLKARVLALEALARQQTFVVFRPEDVDLEHPFIRGYVLEKGQWESYLFPYPTFIFDNIRERNNPAFTYLYSQFENIEMTYQFKQQRLENDRLYELLYKDEGLRKVLLPSLKPQSLNAAMRFIEQEQNCVIQFLKDDAFEKIYIEQREGSWLWQQGDVYRDCTMRELRQQVKSILTYSPFFQQVQRHSPFLCLHYINKQQEWERFLTYPMLEEGNHGVQQYLELVPFANTSWSHPQKTLDELHRIGQTIVEKISDALQMDLHHLQLKFSVTRDGEIHLVEAEMDEPESDYVSAALAQALMDYLEVDQL